MSLSPFCLKLDAFLRMTGIPHEAITTPAPFGGPKRKAPWIEHDGRTLGDSSFIIADLTERFGVDLDRGLSPAQRGQALAIQRLVEENLYWAMVHDRWRRPENALPMRKTILGGLPAPLRPLVQAMARRGVVAQLNGHGMGRHADAEIAAIARRDIEAISAMLGDGAWFFGDEPTLTDAVVFSLLANIHYPAFASPMKAMVAERPALVAFLERFRARFYP